jgi:hypothetical protein
VGIFFVPIPENHMIPIPKAVIDLAVTVLAAITSEVLAKRSAIQRCASDRIASSDKEERNDRPS